MKTPKKVIFPVGGLGTRFLPATKSMPKEMLPVVDKPIIQYAYEEAKDSGIEKYVFVTGRNKAAIINHFDLSYELDETLNKKNKSDELDLSSGWLPQPGNIIFTRQQAPLGLGHAVWCARNMIDDEPFAVILADDMMMCDEPALKQLIDVYMQKGGNVVALVEVPDADVEKFGIIWPESVEGNVVKAKGIVEKPKLKDAPSRLSVIGRYVLEPAIFKYLSEQKKGSGGEIQLTDALSAMMQEAPLHGVLVSGKRFDCGDKTGYINANIAYSLARKDIGAGVRSFIDSL